MKWYRMLLAVVLLTAVGACANPTAPRYPQEDEDPNTPDDPPSQGTLLAEGLTFWV